MFGLGSHFFELIIILLLALLVFGPKKLIEMAGQFGRAFRQLRDATKDMNWSNLISPDEQDTTPTNHTYSNITTYAPPAAATVSEAAPPAEDAPAATTAQPAETAASPEPLAFRPRVVEGSAEVADAAPDAPAATIPVVTPSKAEVAEG